MAEGTLQLNKERSAPTATRSVDHLFVVLECARPLAGGSRHSLEGVREVLIGRGAKREVVRSGERLTIRMPDPSVSSNHAAIRRSGDTWSVEDTRSTNGTFLDGEQITKRELTDGALLDVGQTLFTIRSKLPTSSQVESDIESAQLPGRDLGFATLIPEYSVALGRLIEIALSRVFVLLLGETGTGKEVLARGIHQVSHRRGAFVPVNCGAIPENLVEGQLFGHTKGAFSGATRDEPGFVRASDGGTLLLDEIGDLPPSSQAALLRVLQEREVTAIGATRPVKVDLRVVAATHRPIAALAKGESFRSDLYARLAGYTHELLPLRARREDLGLLICEILPKVARERAPSLRLDIELGRALYRHAWPRNVRELEQELAAAVVFAADGIVRAAHVSDSVRHAKRGGSIPPPTSDAGSARPDSDAIRGELIAALTTHAGNISEVARQMGRTRMQIHRWMKRFGIDPETYRG